MGDGHHPALLNDVPVLLPTFPLDVKIKNWLGGSGFDPTHAFAVEVAELARPIDVVTCFYWPTMHAIKAARPHVKIGLLVDEGGSFTDAIETARGYGHEMIAPHWPLLLHHPFDPDGL